jgi:hypothetical protein
VFRYLKGIIDYGLRHVLDREIRLQGYDDSDWADSVTDRKSTSGFCFSMGSAVIAWFNRKQTSVALSMDEIEYITTCSTSSEVVWLQKLLAGLFDLELEVTCICCDNESCIMLS